MSFEHFSMPVLVRLERRCRHSVFAGPSCTGATSLGQTSLTLDAVRLLGGDENTRMLLHKPCYGQLDAPKRCHMGAARRLKDLGWVPHPTHGSMSMVVCLNQPKVMQLQFYADFSHFMLMTCSAPATWHQQLTRLPKLP